MVLYGMPLSMSLLGFGMGTMLANFHMCGIMLALRAVFNMFVRHVGGTRGSGTVSNASDVLWMSVVRGMRGVGEVGEMCMCLARGGVGE